MPLSADLVLPGHALRCQVCSTLPGFGGHDGALVVLVLVLQRPALWVVRLSHELLLRDR